MTEEKESKAGKPPYVSWGVFKKVLDKIRERKPTPVTLDVLHGWRASESNAKKVLPALKFLGIVNDDGTANADLWNRLTMKGAEQQTGLEEAVRQAYKPLFNEYMDVKDATRDDLENSFARSPWNVAAGSRQSAYHFFVGICAEAGIELGEQHTGTRGRAGTATEAASKPGKPARRTQKDSRSRRHTGSAELSLTVSLQLTGQESEEELEELFAKAKRAYEKAFGRGE